MVQSMRFMHSFSKPSHIIKQSTQCVHRLYKIGEFDNSDFSKLTLNILNHFGMLESNKTNVYSMII